MACPTSIAPGPSLSFATSSFPHLSHAFVSHSASSVRSELFTLITPHLPFPVALRHAKIKDAHARASSPIPPPMINRPTSLILPPSPSLPHPPPPSLPLPMPPPHGPIHTPRALK